VQDQEYCRGKISRQPANDSLKCADPPRRGADDDDIARRHIHNHARAIPEKTLPQITQITQILPRSVLSRLSTARATEGCLFVVLQNIGGVIEHGEGSMQIGILPAAATDGEDRHAGA
jgi:hypothetical protein